MTLACGDVENCVKVWDMAPYSSALATQLSAPLHSKEKERPFLIQGQIIYALTVR